MAREILVERYFPDVLTNAREFRDVAEAENPEFKRIFTAAEKWFRNGFALDLDADGATRWEGTLKIRPKAADTLEARKARILLRINDMLPYTHRRLEQMLAIICGEGGSFVTLDYNNYSIDVRLDTNNIKNTSAVGNLLNVVVPANLTPKVITGRQHSHPLYHAHVTHATKKTTIYPAISLRDSPQRIYIAQVRHIIKRTTIYPKEVTA